MALLDAVALELLLAVAERPVTRTPRSSDAATGVPYVCTTGIAGSYVVSATTLLAITSAGARIVQATHTGRGAPPAALRRDPAVLHRHPSVRRRVPVVRRAGRLAGHPLQL